MIYMDNAATSYPKPREVLRAAAYAMAHCGNPGRSGHALSSAAAGVVLECRLMLAEYFEVSDPMRFVFTLNCTDSLNLAINGMLFGGGHVVATVLEHNSVLRPLHHLSALGQVSIDFALPDDEGTVTPQAIEQLLTPDTRLVIVTHASNVTGAVQPVEEIARMCRRHSVPLLVDGAQAAGHIRIHLEELDNVLYAFPGHKAFLAPQGCGGLYISPGLSPLPLRFGGTGSYSMSLKQPTELPDYYESGTLPTPALAGWAAGIKYLLRNEAGITENLFALTDALRSALLLLPGCHVYSPPPVPGRCCGVISFNLEGISSTSLAEQLEKEYAIACRPGLHCAPLVHRHLGTQTAGALRFSIGHATTRQDAAKCIAAVKLLAQQYVKGNG